MNSFAFGLWQEVRMALSEEKGIVIGRAEYTHGENTYLVRYAAGDGCQRESWFGESALAA
jgi:hypothetical protein